MQVRFFFETLICMLLALRLLLLVHHFFFRLPNPLHLQDFPACFITSLIPATRANMRCSVEVTTGQVCSRRVDMSETFTRFSICETVGRLVCLFCASCKFKPITQCSYNLQLAIVRKYCAPDIHMYRYNKMDMRDFIARVKSFMAPVTRTKHTLFGQRLGGTSTQLARR